MEIEFTPNANVMKAFNSDIMLINDIENSENGQIRIKAGADGPPIHTHPEQEEYFHIINGQLEVYNKDKWISKPENPRIQEHTNPVLLFY